MNAAKCQQPGCSGNIVESVCTSCGSSTEPAPESDTVAVRSGNPGASAGNGARANRARQNSSISSVSAHPHSLSTLSEAQSLKSAARKTSVSSKSTRVRLNLVGEYVVIEPPPPVEPLQLLKPTLQLPAAQRVCSNSCCLDDDGTPSSLIGLGDDGKPTLVESGVCQKCSTPFSFEQLQEGTLISGQYEIKGPIASGGCGFVYLAWDVNVGRYVVLKGLINSHDKLAEAAAIQERQFLANLRDPSIVSIINFVYHKSQCYIVEEFIDGISLKQLRSERRGPLLVQEAISYTLGMLPSFEYLHSRRPRIIFCDGKLDNFMVQGNRVRMIDLGGARHEHDVLSAVYLTVGYCAPEAYTNPSIVSDLYTVGRCLAVLLCNFDFMGEQSNSLPTPQEEPLFARYESLYRFLLRSTAEDTNDRFQSAVEMEQQLWGVLKEIVALDTGSPIPGKSPFFSMDVGHDKNTPAFLLLPDLKLDLQDPAFNMIESAFILNEPLRRQAIFEQAKAEFPHSVEAPLRIANCLIENRQFDLAESELSKLYQQDPYDWRIAWLKGKLLLAQYRAQEALPYFDAVYSEIPGELAPKLALALASELSGDLNTAIRFYDLVSRVDPGYTAASFGLARCLVFQQNKKGAVEAYNRIPPESTSYTDAVAGMVTTLLHSEPEQPDKEAFLQAAEALKTIALDNYIALRLQADLMMAALRQIESGSLPFDQNITLLDVPLLENELRNNLESTLRQCARFAPTDDDRISLIDEANKIRRYTWL